MSDEIEKFTADEKRVTLAWAKDWLRERVKGKGAPCPCCGQFAKVYHRSLHATSARELIRFYRVCGTDWGKPIETAGKNSPDMVKARYWGLMEKQPGVRDDGSNRVGIWRLTDDGVDFVKGDKVIRKKVKLYDGRPLGFEGKLVTIQDCLGKKFNYSELMEG